jgi:hypothetical protein
MRASRFGPIVACAAVLACGGDAPPPPEVPAAAPAARAPQPGDPSCPRDGLWKPCALVDRIGKSGLAFKETGDTLRVPFLSVPGVRYRVGTTAVLVAFFYPDTLAVAKDVAALDTVRLVAKGDTINPWGGVPKLVRSVNLVTVLVDGSETQLERIGLSITAGAPQPASEPAPVVLPSVPNKRP